jgi:hypothetical protein
MSHQDIITIEPGKRGGKPCIRGMRMTVYDVLESLLRACRRKRFSQIFHTSRKKTFSPSQLRGGS